MQGGQNPKKKNRFLAFLSSLCSSKEKSSVECQPEKKKCKNKISKTPRLTFQLDRVLVKVSRKNMAEQQLMESQVLTFQLENHIFNRLKQCDIVIFSGQFSTCLTEKLPYSLQIKRTQEEAFEQNNNYLLSNIHSKIKIKMDSVDAMVYQLYFGQTQQQYSNQQYQASQKQQQSEICSQSLQNLDEIEEILRFYHKKIKSFIFICHKNMKLADAHHLFLVFKENYLFEFQRVKKMQKIVCNIIYVSTEPKFLKIQSIPLCQFIISEIDKLNIFEPPKIVQKSMKKERKNSQFTLYRKSPTQQREQMKIQKEEVFFHQRNEKKQFQALILNMLQENLHIPITQTLAIILDSQSKKPKTINWFLEVMSEKCPQIKQQIYNFKKHKPSENNEEQMKFFNQFTPVFEIKHFQQLNFAKTSGLFKTNDEQDQDYAAQQGQKSYEEMQF